MLIPTPLQDRWLSQDEPFATYAGGRGSGKTTALLMEVGRWIHYSDFRALLVADPWLVLLPHLSKKTFPDVFHQAWGDDCTFSSVTRQFVFPSGARVQLLSVDRLNADPRRISGCVYSFVGIDTTQKITEDAAQMLLARSLVHGHFPARMRQTCLVEDR